MSANARFNLAQEFVGDCWIVTDNLEELRPPKKLCKMLDYCLNELFQKFARDINPKRWFLPELSITLTDCGQHLQELRAEFKLPDRPIPFFVLKELYEDDQFVKICFEQQGKIDQEVLYKGMLFSAYRKAFRCGVSC